MFQKSPHRQSWRDRRTHSCGPAASWAFTPSRSIPTSIAMRCTCVTPTKRISSGRRRRANRICAPTRFWTWRRKSGADAIHPGYGFLAEREDFAQACDRRGRSSSSGRSHPPSRRWATRPWRARPCRKRACPSCPAPKGRAVCAMKRSSRIAPQIGFPLLIKATAGGGGKGMRRVDRDGGSARCAGLGAARSRIGLWRWRGLSGKTGAGRAPHRDSTAGRRARQRHSSGRARMLDSTPASEDHRRVAIARRSMRICASTWAQSP